MRLFGGISHFFRGYRYVEFGRIGQQSGQCAGDDDFVLLAQFLLLYLFWLRAGLWLLLLVPLMLDIDAPCKPPAVYTSKSDSGPPGKAKILNKTFFLIKIRYPKSQIRNRKFSLLKSEIQNPQSEIYFNSFSFELRLTLLDKRRNTFPGVFGGSDLGYFAGKKIHCLFKRHISHGIKGFFADFHSDGTFCRQTL